MAVSYVSNESKIYFMQLQKATVKENVLKRCMDLQ